MIEHDRILQTLDDPRIRRLCTDAFSDDDVVNLILQRSEIIWDQVRPGKIIRAWTEGDASPARSLVERMGEQLIRRAAAIILLEYRDLEETIGRIAPLRVADIGCGYAFFDLFLWQDFKPNIVLIDLEESRDRHFGYRETGAAYSSLEVARKMLVNNGVTDSSITCINPAKNDVMKYPEVDLAVSFISCGFHYPVDTYLDFFASRVKANGSVIIDVRARQARDAVGKLSSLGAVSRLASAAHGKADRILLQKQLSA